MIDDEAFHKKRVQVNQAYLTARRILEDLDRALEAADAEDKEFREIFYEAYSVRHKRLFK
jgi:hypothetical protein